MPALVPLPSYRTSWTTPHPTPYPATKGLMFGSVGMEALQIVKDFEYYSPEELCRSRRKANLTGSSCYRPFLLLGYFPSWRCSFGTRPWGISHTQDRAGSVTEEGFRTVIDKDALC